MIVGIVDANHKTMLVPDHLEPAQIETKREHAMRKNAPARCRNFDSRPAAQPEERKIDLTVCHLGQREPGNCQPRATSQ